MAQRLTIKISTPFIKLDGLLKFASLVSSGGEAKQLIRDGEVKLNGEVCTVPGKKVFSKDTVLFDGYEIVVEDENL